MRYAEIVQVLVERRRNPHLNAKIPTLDELQKYAGRDDIFVSYTHDVGSASHGHKWGDDRHKAGLRASGDFHNTRGAKIGIFPKSEYDTPLGIYTYPIDYVLSKKGEVPFAQGRPYVYVLRVRDASRMLDVNAYTDADFKRDLTTLLKHPHARRSGIKQAIDDASFQTPGGKIWNVTRNLAEWTTDDYNEEAREIDDYDPYDYDDEDEYGDPIPNPEQPRTVAQQPVQWSRILRDLGYDGAIDRKGTGVIHTNEPTQAVFFIKTALDEVDIIANRYHRDPKTPQQVWHEKPDILRRMIRQGRVSNEEIISFLGGSGFGVLKIGFENLPPEVQKYVTAHYKEFISDYSSQVLSVLPLTDEQWLSILHEHPYYIVHHPAPSPAIMKYVLDHLERFKEVIGSLKIPAEDIIRQLSKDNSLHTYLPKSPSEVSPAVLKWIIDNHPDWFARFSLEDEAADPAIYEYFFVKAVIGGHFAGNGPNLLDRWARCKMWPVFVRCFNRLTARDGATYVRQRLRWQSNLPDEVVAQIAHRPAVKAAFDHLAKTAK